MIKNNLKSLIDNIFLNEDNSFGRLNNNLPKHIFIGAKEHKHSLGQHPSFPIDDEKTFEEKILTKRCDELSSLVDGDYIDFKNQLSRVIVEIKQKEKPYKQRLEQLCLEYIVDLFDITSDEIDLSVELCDKISNEDIKHQFCEPIEIEYEFENSLEQENLTKEVYKRRLINALNEGLCVRFTENIQPLINEIYKLDPDLVSLYNKSIILNNVLTFFHLPNKNNILPSAIHDININNIGISAWVKGINFIALLSETVKTILNTLSLNALPNDKDKIKYITGKADFTNAYIWDNRLGVGLWDIIDSMIDEEEKDLVLATYMKLITLPTDNFFNVMKEIFSKTKEGKNLINTFKNKIKKDIGFSDLNNKLNQKRKDFSLINDGFIGVEEL